MAFQETLANSIGNYKDHSTFAQLTIKNLTETLALKVDWLKILRSLVDFDIDESYEILLVKPDLMKAAFEFLNSMDNRIFANIFTSRFVLDFTHVYSIYFLNYYEHKLWGIENTQQRFEQCLRIVRTQLPVAFTSLLIKKATNKRIIDDAHDIANRTMKVIIDEVENDETLPSKDRSFMVEKLKSMKLILGYPEELLEVQNVELVYKDLNLTGNENLLKLILETYIFTKKQEFKHMIRTHEVGFERDETTRWIDYTTEDEYVTPLYDLEAINTICEKKG